MKKSNYDMDSIKNYAIHMFKRNLAVFDQCILSAEDFLHEAFAVGFDTEEQAQKIITDLILTEKRKQIGFIQLKYKTIGIIFKTCSGCRIPKDTAEFGKRYDKRTNFSYFNNLCNECENERKRLLYAKSIKVRHSSHLRYMRYKNRQALSA